MRTQSPVNPERGRGQGRFRGVGNREGEVKHLEDVAVVHRQEEKPNITPFAKGEAVAGKGLGLGSLDWTGSYGGSM
jgi:hypothetical protein